MVVYFFFNDPATTEIYTLSLHDALPIYPTDSNMAAPLLAKSFNPFLFAVISAIAFTTVLGTVSGLIMAASRSEEHTSELQSRQYLVCRLLLEKKIRTQHNSNHTTLALPI